MRRIACILVVVILALGKALSEPCGDTGELNFDLSCLKDIHLRGEFVPGKICFLDGIRFADGCFNISHLDLSNLQLALNEIKHDVFHEIDRNGIVRLNLSGNFLCDQDYIMPDYYWIGNPFYQSYLSFSSVTHLVATFPKLNSLDISKTLQWPGVNNEDECLRLGRSWKERKSLWSLDISNNGANGQLLPHDFQGMVHLKQLNMSKCCSLIQDDGSLFHDLVSMENLDLSFTQWSSINPYLLHSMKNLKNISLRSLKTPNIECTTRNLKYYRSTDSYETFEENSLPLSSLFRKQVELETVDLSSLDCTLNISKLHFVSTKLHSLHMQDNQLRGFNGKKTCFGLPNPKALRTLDLSGSVHKYDEESITTTLENLVNLETLSLRGSKGVIDSLNYAFMPSENNLKTLDLSLMHFYYGMERSNPRNNCFRALGNLQTLIMHKTSVSGNLYLGNRPDYDYYSRTNNLLPNIINIDLSSSSIETLVVDGVKNLETLNLGSARIKRLELSNLDNLKWLNVTSIEAESISLSNLEQLESLSLTNASVSKIDIKKMPSLAKVEMDSANITQLGSEQLPNLRYLNASSLQQRLDLTKVRISHFESLEILDLSASGIFELPEKCFAKLTKLKYLNLSKNALDSLPANLFGETGNSELEHIDLSDNYIRALPLDNFKTMTSKRSNWTINLTRNIIDCDDCNNSWLGQSKYRSHLIGARCTSPFGKYNQSVSIGRDCH